MAVKPRMIRLEASSHCQLRCPSCPTTTGAIDAAVGSGFLRFEDFRALVDANPWVRRIELSNYGEILLNPHLARILEYGQARGVTLAADNGVNLNHARPELLEALVRFRLRSMTCSIDGASEETYRKYRVRGSFERVIANLRALNALKAQHGSNEPALIWQFVVFGHNQHEIPAARSLARELGMKFKVKWSWDESFSPIRDAAGLKKLLRLDHVGREEYRKRHGAGYMDHIICGQLWSDPQINWDGKVLGCCRNFWGDFGGNAFRDGLLPAINHEKMQYARAMLEGKAAPRDDIPCTTCDVYRHRKANAHWVEKAPAASNKA